MRVAVRTRSAALVATLLVFTGTLISAHVPAPNQAGAWIVPGSANVSSSHDQATDVSTTDIRVQPTALRFLNTHLAVGGALPPGYSAADGSHTYLYGIGRSVRRSASPTARRSRSLMRWRI